MPKPKSPILDKNEYCCPSQLDQLFGVIEELNFLCRANKKVKGGFSINKIKLDETCDTVVKLIKEIKDNA